MNRIYLEEERMTFGGHLDELRRRIIYSIFALVFGIVFGLVFLQDELFELVLRPHQQASKQRACRVAQKNFSLANEALRQVIQALPDLSPPACYALLPELTRKQLLTRKFEAFYGQLLDAGDNNLPPEGRAKQQAELAREHMDILNQFITQELVKSRVNQNLTVRVSQAHERFDALMTEYGGSLRNLFKIPGLRGDSHAEETKSLLPELMDALKAAESRADPADQAALEAAQAEADRLSAVLKRGLSQLEKGIDLLAGGKLDKIVVLKYTEQFFSYLKVVMIFGLFLASPLVLYQMWRFVGAGLYKHEQRVFLTFVPFSFMLFLTGLLFGYFVLVPVGLSFLSSYGDPDLVSPMLNLSAYLSLFFTLTLVLGLIFQVPLLMFFLCRTGMVSPAFFAKYRRQAILIGVIMGAVLTPPDPYTQLMMAVPLIVLYEIGIWVGRVAFRKVSHDDEEEDEDPSDAAGEEAPA